MGKKSDGPIRSCIGCHSRFSKQNLLRFSADSFGRLVLDTFHCKSGRGAYLCPLDACFVKALKRKGAFSKALRCHIEISQQPQELAEEVILVLRKEREKIQNRLKELNQGEGQRLAFRLQGINLMIERLRNCEK